MMYTTLLLTVRALGLDDRLRQCENPNLVMAQDHQQVTCQFELHNCSIHRISCKVLCVEMPMIRPSALRTTIPPPSAVHTLP